MTEFRSALESFDEGQTDLPALERELRSTLAREPQLAADFGALIEASYRAGHIPGSVYLSLIEITRSVPRPHAVPSASGNASPAGAAPSANGNVPPPGAAESPEPSWMDPEETKYRPADDAVAEGHEDATRLVATTSEDLTRLRTAASDSARPVANKGPTGPAATGPDAANSGLRQPPTANRQPLPSDHPSADATLLSGRADKSSPRTGGSTGPSWGDPAQSTEGEARALQPGDVVKERFVLEDIIGKGGMGVVFRARDLRKEEAQDRHPHVALKVLNDEFKRHPESLKALQREARKAQNLAHPNIVTVYDFDRDGANVYMVMELLEGEPLDRYIRQLNGKGISIGKALPIIRALCGALAYAHEHGVVHSDFKPANAYFTRRGAIKVFDFGIARAARHQGDLDETATKTLFDPGTLGALTPAYASCEMIDGLEPDPRDDVYALGCVAYELLTGRHPFDRKPATQARSAKLKPKPVSGLTRRQWRGLRRSLAFERSARIASVTKFLEELSPEQRSPALWIGSAAAVVVVGVSVALLVPQYLQKRRVDALTEMIRSGAPASIEQALPGIQALPPDARAAMLLDEDLRSRLIGHFNTRIEAATDSSRQKYDYPQAETLIGQLKLLFPDSQAVSQIGERLTTRKNDEIKQQSDRFDELLGKGWLVEQQNAENISGVLAVIRQIDPQHPLLKDPRLPSAYAEQAQVAIRQSDLPLAQSLVTAGLAVAPSDNMLRDLNDRVSSELDAQQRAERLAQLKRDLPKALSGATTLAAFESLHEELRAFGTLAPDDADLKRLQALLQKLLDGEVQSLAAKGSYDEAQDLVAQYADVTRADYVEQQRAALERGRSKSGNNAASTRDATVATLKTELDTLLKSPDSDERWDARVTAQLAKLSAYLPPSDAYLVSTKHDAATHHVVAARELRSQSRLSEAERSLQRAIAYAPELEAVVQERQLLADVRAQQESRRKEQKRLAELAALKQKLLDQATANEVDEALGSLLELRAGLPVDDSFLSAAAPQAIAGAYVRLAGIAAREGRFDSAVAQIDHALEFDRANTRTAALRKEYAQQLAAAQSNAAAKNEATAPASQLGTPTAPSGAPTAQPGALTGTAPSQPTTTQVASASSTGEGSPKLASAPATSAPAARSSACRPALAGYGRRSRGICFDTLPGGRGPDLVVIPAGGAVAQPFAISRYEVSVAEYNAFCQQSGKCSSSGAQADLPVTSIPVTDAQHYVEWLSAQTGSVYRLPTDSEWVYAANAKGGSTERNFNCVVEIGGQKIRGFGLTSVRSGRSNSWGLYNQIGNAQEWVKAADGWSVRGGAYSDAISRCGTDLKRSSTGAADAATGFRVVRELQ